MKVNSLTSDSWLCPCPSPFTKYYIKLSFTNIMLPFKNLSFLGLHILGVSVGLRFLPLSVYLFCHRRIRDFYFNQQYMLLQLVLIFLMLFLHLCNYGNNKAVQCILLLFFLSKDKATIDLCFGDSRWKTLGFKYVNQ